jgi:hypothetical protein
VMTADGGGDGLDGSDGLGRHLTIEPKAEIVEDAPIARGH